MLKRHLIFTVLLLFVLGLAGCGSSGGSSSGPTPPTPPSGITGAGAASKGFVTGGTISVQYYSGGVLTAVPGASGNCTNSKVELALPDDWADYLPVLVSLTGATIKAPGGDVTMAADAKLSRLVTAATQKDNVYLTLFSTLKAESWKSARLSGATNDQAVDAGSNALTAVYDSMGLNGTAVTASNLENIDPRTTDATTAAEFEKAQQSARVVLGIGSDDQGLSGLTTQIEDRVASKAASSVVSGGTYTSADFVATVLEEESVSPAQLVTNKQAEINTAVEKTFENAGDITTVTSTEALTKAEAVTASTTGIVGMNIKSGTSVYSKFQTPYDASNPANSPALTVSFVDGAGSAAAARNFNATVVDAGPVLVYGGTEYTTLTNQSSGANVTLRVPADTAAGSYRIRFHSQVSSTVTLEAYVTVQVLAAGTVSISGVSGALNPSSAYVAVGTGDNAIPKNALGTISKTTTTSTSAPQLIANVSAPETTGGSATNFTVKFTLPEGLIFTDLNSRSASGVISFDGSSWSNVSGNVAIGSSSTSGTNPTISTVPVYLGGSTISATGNIKATKELAFGKYAVTAEVFDASSVLVASFSSNIMFVTSDGSNNVARITNLKFAGETTVDAGNHTASPTAVTAKSFQFNATFTGTVQTWSHLAGVAGDVEEPKAALYEDPRTLVGGFWDNSVDHKYANLEIPSTKITVGPGTSTAGETITINPVGETYSWLAITVGGNSVRQQLNYETVILKTWYVDGAAESAKSTSVNGVKFESAPQ